MRKPEPSGHRRRRASHSVGLRLLRMVFGSATAADAEAAAPTARALSAHYGSASPCGWRHRPEHPCCCVGARCSHPTPACWGEVMASRLHGRAVVGQRNSRRGQLAERAAPLPPESAGVAHGVAPMGPTRPLAPSRIPPRHARRRCAAGACMAGAGAAAQPVAAQPPPIAGEAQSPSHAEAPPPTPLPYMQHLWAANTPRTYVLQQLQHVLAQAAQETWSALHFRKPVMARMASMIRLIWTASCAGSISSTLSCWSCTPSGRPRSKRAATGRTKPQTSPRRRRCPQGVLRPRRRLQQQHRLPLLRR